MSVFYDKFERHAHGEGLKGYATHYCPGCGHGLIHKFIAEAIEELGIQDRTVGVSPVGCAVFMYYYLDVGNTQAAHGRAPAVAIGHKVANPGAIVFAYQGDGDLASIGLAEIMQACQLGIPMTFIFVNNAIYGMTGGQMAPTTLPEQITATSPTGRTRMMGQPLRMAEIVAQIDGPVYVERCALFDPKQRTRAKHAIAKAFRLQAENKGLAFVEILAECPTHLKLTPTETEQWVREHMLPYFPLGVKKDTEPEPWFTLGPPSFDPDRIAKVLGASSAAAPKFGTGFPTHIDPHDISIKFAGAGGDGAQTIAMLTTKAAINEGYDSTHIPSYGPESRGGTSYADVHIALEEVLSPSSPRPHILVAFNPPSLEKFGPTVRPGGTIIYDSSIVQHPPTLPSNTTVVPIPASEIAQSLGSRMIKNTVALGALAAATRLLPDEAYFHTLRTALKNNCALLDLNLAAFDHGRHACEEVLSGV